VGEEFVNAIRGKERVTLTDHLRRRHAA
jgi:hypothetical protein